MDKTRDAVVQQAELRWDWEHRPKGEEWEFEMAHWGSEIVTVTKCPGWHPALWYRRKTEPEKPFRAWTNVYKTEVQCLKGGVRQNCMLHPTQSSADAVGGDRVILCQVLPADELAKLERYNNAMLAALEQLVESAPINDAIRICVATYKQVTQCDS
jgi:hypothetical protein